MPTTTAPATVAAPHPFLKWAGGKRSLLPQLLARFPERVGSYCEPFVGGGSVFFALTARNHGMQARLSDANRRLIDTYTTVRDTPTEVLRLLRRHAAQDSRDHYYETRDRLNRGRIDRTHTAAAFIYLNKAGFNGMYRESQAGRFNVPWGHHKSRYAPDVDGLAAASGALSGTELVCCEFDASPVDPDTFYYLDPPYHNTFSGYTKHSFDDDTQGRVADFCNKLDVSGARFVLSNSDTPLTRDLYRDFVVEEVVSRSTVSRSVSSRGQVRELLVRNFDPEDVR